MQRDRHARKHALQTSCVAAVVTHHCCVKLPCETAASVVWKYEAKMGEIHSFIHSFFIAPEAAQEKKYTQTTP